MTPEGEKEPRLVCTVTMDRLSAPEAPCIDLWAWRLDTSGTGLRRLHAHLSGEETARAARFAEGRAADHYVAGRGRMREILSAYAGDEPAALDLRTGPHGKPFLAGAAAHALRFNLAHSEGVAVLAVARGVDVGIDVEHIRPIEASVARRFFSAAEQEALALLDGEDRLAAFYRCWTRKEALLKGLGCGLTAGLDSFGVTLGPSGPPRILRFDARPDVARCWLLHHFELPPDLIGAVASSGLADLVWREAL